jgi:phosphoserine phosphatase
MSQPLSDQPPPYGTVVFDCDSTLSSIEGIDELAAGQRAQIAELTRRAMDGEVPLEAVYGLRLARIRPSRARVEALGRQYLEHALPGAAELVRRLQSVGKRVIVVSGGVRPAVLPFAVALGVQPTDVRAVELFFDGEGEYLGFDESSPLTRSGGKIEVLREIAHAPQAGPVAFVGDGVTDLEAAGEVARFVAFTGFARRAELLQRARVVCEAPHAAPLQFVLMTEEEAERSSPT